MFSLTEVYLFQTPNLVIRVNTRLKLERSAEVILPFRLSESSVMTSYFFYMYCVIKCHVGTPKILPSPKATSDLTFSNRYFEIGQRWIIRTGFRLYGNVVVDRECHNVNVSWRPPGGIFLSEGQSDGRYKILSNGTLVIENASLSNAGRYKVRVSTEGGIDESSSELTVICKPELLLSSHLTYNVASQVCLIFFRLPVLYQVSLSPIAFSAQGSRLW